MFRVLFVLVCFVSNVVAQDSVAIKKVLSFQSELNQKFASEENSPLTPKDLEIFKGLNFFAIDTSYQIEAKFVRTPYETPFIMKTTTNREPLYVKYGEAHFVLQEKKWVLHIYQNQGLKTQSEYEDYLFLPFTDLTNAHSTYGGGRFIDLKIPEGDSIHIDFNMAYNPYCAYNERYSCPIPPDINHMEIAIHAGVKNYPKLLEK